MMHNKKPDTVYFLNSED